jgi:hypothetical protein
MACGWRGRNSNDPRTIQKLKVGDRVCFNDNPVDRGKVTAILARYVTIKWDDGHQSFTGHKEMRRVGLLATKK